MAGRCGVSVPVYALSATAASVLAAWRLMFHERSSNEGRMSAMSSGRYSRTPPSSPAVFSLQTSGWKVLVAVLPALAAYCDKMAANKGAGFTSITPADIVAVAPKLVALTMESKRAAIRTSAAKCLGAFVQLAGLIDEAWGLFASTVADEALASLATIAGSDADIQTKEAVVATGKAIQSKLSPDGAAMDLF